MKLRIININENFDGDWENKIEQGQFNLKIINNVLIGSFSELFEFNKCIFENDFICREILDGNIPNHLINLILLLNQTNLIYFRMKIIILKY